MAVIRRSSTLHTFPASPTFSFPTDVLFRPTARRPPSTLRKLEPDALGLIRRRTP